MASERIILNAYVDHDFQRGFVLDEVRVRKLHELISSRLGKFNDPPTLLLKVFRGDSFVYETPSIGDVLKEDNDDWRSITRLEFIAEKEDEFFLRLSFSQRGTSINIVGDDRDSVFLVFSDVREYLQSSVLSRIMVSRDAIRLIGLLVMFVAMIGFLWSVLSSLAPDPETSAKALAATDVGEKINYLIEERSGKKFPSSTVGWLALMVLATVGSTGGAAESAWRLLFPYNVFLFGQRKELHDKQRALLSKVFWGVFVALAVSVLAGVLLAWGGKI